MTAPGYRAEPAAIRDAADGIAALVGELGSLTTAGRAGTGRGVVELALDAAAFGHDGLATVFDGFCTRWEWGVHALVAAGTGMADGLRESMRAYEHTEDEVGSVFSRLLAEAVGDPRTDAGDSDAGDSIAGTWSDVGEDAVATGLDRITRALAGTDPYAPDVDALREIAD